MPIQAPTGEEKFAVYAEAEGRDKPLLLLDLTFARLIDDIVVPYESDEAFFIDGVPLTRSHIKRIKILKLSEGFARDLWDFDRTLTRGDHPNRKIYGDQYHTRFEHILRTNSIDVTSQVIKAYNQAIKPRIKDYLPKREELIGTATKIFIEGMKLLGG